MTPAEQSRAREIIGKATPGAWSYENLNWVGTPLFAVRASAKPNDRGITIFDNIEPDANSYNNIEFITEAHDLFPKALAHIEALETEIAERKAGRTPRVQEPAISPAEIARAKELLENATKGEWSWEDDSHLGKGVYTVYAGRGPMMHGLNLFGRMDTGLNAENDLNFITETHELFPKALSHIETLEQEAVRQRQPRPQAKPPGRRYKL